jgi:hypothetical protein
VFRRNQYFVISSSKDLARFFSMPLPDFSNQESNNCLLFNEDINFDTSKLEKELKTNLLKTYNDQFKTYL